MNLTGQYATDFQNILNKSVATAVIPLSQLQAQDTFILGHKTALGSLESNVSALTASLTNLGTLAAGQALNATSSNPAAVTVSDSNATSAANYTINSVTTVASAASETSLSGYADPNATPITTGTTTPGAMELMVGTKPYDFTLTNNNLTSLMNQINGLGAGITASILTTAGADYLSLQANATGATTLTLSDTSGATPTNIISGTNQGTNAVFHLNGIKITQASNTVNSVIPGMTFNIVGATTSPVTLTLSSDSSQLATNLQSLVTNYNTLVSAVQAQEGKNAGALSGDTIIRQLQTTMHQLTSYSSASGSVHSLADLGVTFNSANGTATFDPTKVGSMSSSQLTDALKYVGSTTTGLGAFSTTFDQLSNPISGLIQTEIAGDTTTDTHLQSQIAKSTASINLMQQGLAKQIEKADALESAYEAQQTQLTSSLQGLDLVLYGKAVGSPGA
jgi:flagellar hook-associated protein 2